jgi:hypothetical protein
MNSIKKFGALLVLSAGLAAPAQLQASGSYCACLPKPPAKTAGAQVDRDKYDLGQKVFNGKTAPVQGDSATQRSQLESLQAQLPAKVAKKKNLPSLAGKLSPEQLDALEYYLENRYPNK